MLGRLRRYQRPVELRGAMRTADAIRAAVDRLAALPPAHVCRNLNCCVVYSSDKANCPHCGTERKIP